MRAGVRALDREHRVAVGDVADGDVELAAPAPEPGEVGFVVRRVGDDQVAVAAEPVGEEVVEDAALLVAQARVLGAADGDRGDVVGEDPLEEGERARPLDLDLAHVGDVEHPGVGPDRGVLLDDPVVLNRHLPAGERDELGAALAMAIEQRSALEVLDGHGARLS